MKKNGVLIAGFVLLAFSVCCSVIASAAAEDENLSEQSNIPTNANATDENVANENATSSSSTDENATNGNATDEASQANEEESSKQKKDSKKQTKASKKKAKDLKKQPQKEIAANELMATEKEIEVNSVNFVKLQSKAKEIFIPDPEILDIQLLSDNSLYLIGLAPGITTLVINDKDGNSLVDCKIKVTYPINTIKAAIKEIHPDSDVDIMSVDKSIVLRGRVPSPEVANDAQEIASKFVDSSKIVNKLIIQTATQVMLKVKIAEVSRDLTKSLGVSWRTLSSPRNVNGITYGFAGGNVGSFFEKQADTDALTTKLLEANGILSTEKNARWLIYNQGHNSLSGLIDALASESFASVLAEPTIVALSGSTAKFKSGGEQGYTVKQEGSDSYTTEFKDWGTEIEFTPIVLSEDRINITVSPKVSTIKLGNAGLPELTTKEATTTVELGSGQSLAIAGLLQTTSSTSTNETPFLSDIPLVGSIFRNSSMEKVQKELIIIITPYIVKPSSKQLKAPTDMVPRMYSPLESVLHRRFHNRVKKTHNAGFSIK